jgi:hypothetical protein
MDPLGPELSLRVLGESPPIRTELENGGSVSTVTEVLSLALVQTRE